ncbi:porin [Paraburkholderia sp. SARCC-3016]|jgi:predicted porin|uniref:porin n=1 Tax=Paraburkholderia sp. SARCC-3016 TaxID=3058611 RepID=UPI002806B1FE|nr:porin [Paraburkholderia sp. SARCC-3016]MDQ7979629.1 porin [Paraburkholderia sp. SARCC-3016]
MKKTLIVAAVAASFVPLAHAQSSVTLYGLIDAGFTYTNNVDGSGRAAIGSGIDQSRWGLRGSEDLGGGLKAIFNLESGFDINNGRLANDGSLFNRQAYVGLSSDYGTVTLGRQWDAMQDYVAPLTATGSWGGTYFAHPFNNDNLNTNGGFPVNNSIKYASANYGGFTFGGTYGFSNQSSFANNREYSFGAAYQYEGLRVAAAYSQQNNPGATSNGATTDPDMSAIYAATGGFRQREFGVGVSYAFGPAQVGVAWTQSRMDNFDMSAGSSAHVNNYEVNAKYNFTPALSAGIAYTYTDGDYNVSGVKTNVGHLHQVGVQTDYALSKRTDVYAQVVYQRATGDQVGAASIYSGSASQLSSSQNQAAATVGLRHRF